MSLKWDNAGDCCQIGKATIKRIVDLAEMPMKASFLFPDSTPEMLHAAHDELGDIHVDYVNQSLLLSFQAFLIDIDGKLILVDSCCGNDKNRERVAGWHKRQGPFLENLALYGVAPEDIDFVMCTHLHVDHVGWNTRLVNGKWVPTFPNAQYILARKELSHWKSIYSNKKNQIGMSYQGYKDSVLPILDSGQAMIVESDFDFGSGVFLEDTNGHSPGHVSVHCQHEKDHALICGDVFHHAIQLRNPDLSTNFCSDKDASRETRHRILSTYADTDTLILPAHFKAPLFGSLARDKGAYKIV